MFGTFRPSQSVTGYTQVVAIQIGPGSQPGNYAYIVTDGLNFLHNAVQDMKKTRVAERIHGKLWFV